MLEYIYTDNVKQLENKVDVLFALNLLAIADQYLINGLKMSMRIIY